MNLFDKKFVYLEWDDVLEDKEVFVADTLSELRRRVESNISGFRGTVEKNDDDYPFTFDDNAAHYAMVYYDPNYECKRAYAQGKKIQYRNKDSSDPWKDCAEEPYWTELCEYRVKPEEQEFHVYKSSDETLHLSKWCTAAGSIFEGTEEECRQYIKEHYCSRCTHQSCMIEAGIQFCKGFKEREYTCSSCQYQCTPDVEMPCVTCEEYSNYKSRIVMQGEWEEDIEMTGALREVAMAQYRKLEYPVTHEELYCAGFEAGVKYVYARLREEHLKEIERTMDKVLNALVSWKPEVKE